MCCSTVVPMILHIINKQISVVEPNDRRDDRFWLLPDELEENLQKTKQAFPRKALLVLLQVRTGHSFEAVVCLRTKSVLRFEDMKDVQAPFTPADYEICEQVVKSNQELKKHLEKRGISQEEGFN